MVNYLFSKIINDNSVQKEYLLKNIKSGMNITYISSVPDNHERTDEQVNKFTSYFNSIGINFNEVFYIDSRVSESEAHSSILKSDVVFLTGGSPELQMELINNYNLANDIKTRKIVIGVSAGAMNQGKRIVYKDDFDNFKNKDYVGLGLTNINIFPHFDESNQDIVDEVNEVSDIHEITCIPNESFVYVENGNKEILGDYYEPNKTKGAFRK